MYLFRWRAVQSEISRTIPSHPRANILSQKCLDLTLLYYENQTAYGKRMIIPATTIFASSSATEKTTPKVICHNDENVRLSEGVAEMTYEKNSSGKTDQNLICLPDCVNTHEEHNCYWNGQPWQTRKRWTLIWRTFAKHKDYYSEFFNGIKSSSQQWRLSMWAYRRPHRKHFCKSAIKFQ